ncbi:MAG: TolC family protein [Syntrophobacteraceae bacterium]|jgi:outer membrane protein TolC
MTKKALLQSRSLQALLCIFIITLSLGTSQAAEPKAFSLDQLIQMALQTSPELKMAEQDILAAKSEYNEAKGGQLPQIDLVGIVGPAEDAKFPTVVLTGPKSGVIVSHDEGFGAISVFGRLDFAITQPLYTFGKISNRRDAAALGVEAQTAAREERRNKIVLNVKELYYAYLIALQGKNAARDADTYIDDAGKRIKRLIELKAKNVDPSDLYRMDAFAAEVKAFAAKAESGSITAYAALKKAVGLPDHEELKLKETELPKNPAELEPEGEYIQRAIANRPEILEVKKGVEAKGKLTEAAEADLYPSFFAAATGSLAGAPDREKFDNSYLIDNFNHAYAGVFAGAQWHLDFGIGQGKLDKARAEYQKMRNTQEFAEKNIPVEVIKYYQDTVEAYKSFTAYEQAAVGARRWIVTAFSNFDLGIGTARDMFDAIDRYGKNQGNYLQSLYNYHVSLARLDYATGKRIDMP